MDQPLGRYVGNALEVMESVEVLKGGGPSDLVELCIELAGWMIYLGGRATNLQEGKEKASNLIASGAAFEKFRAIVRLQGGNDKVLNDFSLLPQAKNRLEVLSPDPGIITRIDCEKVGIASLVLGGGRETKEDNIDPAVGIILHKKTGDRVSVNEPLCTLHYNRSERLDEARSLILSSYILDLNPAMGQRRLVIQVIGK
jgi:thymidine phosphorylase